MIRIKSWILGFLFLLITASLCGEAFAADVSKSGVHAKASLSFSDAFVRAVPENVQSTNVYLTITNNSDNTERLVGASSSFAERVEIHKIMDNHGVRRMHEIEEIVIPPHSPFMLKLGAYHLMLIGLKQPLVVGEKVPVELHFASAGKIMLMAPVVALKVKAKEAKTAP